MFGASVLILGIVVVAAGCRGSAPPPDDQAVAQPPYTTSATIKDLMLSMIDTAADDVWLSVSTVSTATGTVETAPKNDEDWNKIRRGAITLAEAANLLMIPGRKVARPGEKSETPGVELEPEEMDVLIAKDRASWNQRALDLHKAALEVLAAVDERNADKVFEVGERIEIACENCHSQYWYPNEQIPDVSVSGIDTTEKPSAP
jgi:hypothetical protein